MYWLNPTFTPMLVFAACMLTFGFLAFLLTNRKAARSAVPDHSAKARRSPARPVQNGHATNGSRHTASSTSSSGIGLSLSANYSPSEEARVVAQSVAQLKAPLNSAVLRARKELFLDLDAPPLADLTPAGSSENELPATPQRETGESALAAPAVEQVASAIAKQPTQEIVFDSVQDLADDPALALQPAGPEERPTEGAERLTAPSHLPPPPAQTETLERLVASPAPQLNSSENVTSHSPKFEANETAFSSPATNELARTVGARPSEKVAPANGLHATDDPVSAWQSGFAGKREAKIAMFAPVPKTARVATLEKEPVHDLLEFHGLRQQPFDVTPDPAYLYLTPSHQEALAALRQGIDHLRGFMMLVAEPGMGKTTLMNKLMEEIADSARVVFLFQTQGDSSELLAFILDELEVDHAGMGVVAMHRVLNQTLLEEMLRGRRFVLIVDEAQNLQEPVLETIRLLSDFETTHSKLIQIVLVGQPQLADTLMRPGLKQLRQRVAVLTSLRPLDAGETRDYIEHRLRVAGWSGNPLFTWEALTQIAESSQGIPRSINNLCFNALLAAFTDGHEIIDADIIKSVAGKLNLEAVGSLQEVTAPVQSATPADHNWTEELARAVVAAVTAETRRELNDASNVHQKPKSGVTVYIGEETATQAGKPIRIRIDQG